MGKIGVMYSVWVGNLWCVMRDVDEETVVMHSEATFAVALAGCIWGGRFGLVVPTSSARLPVGINYEQCYVKLS